MPGATCELRYPAIKVEPCVFHIGSCTCGTHPADGSTLKSLPFALETLRLSEGSDPQDSSASSYILLFLQPQTTCKPAAAPPNGTRHAAIHGCAWSDSQATPPCPPRHDIRPRPPAALIRPPLRPPACPRPCTPSAAPSQCAASCPTAPPPSCTALTPPAAPPQSPPPP